MKILRIEQTVREDNAIDVTVEIENKIPLVLNFIGSEALPFINDCVFLSLYIQSMQEGSDLCIPEQYPISSQLVENLAKHQSIFTLWYPKELNPITVKVNAKQLTYSPQGEVALFSGGIDSFYTYVSTHQRLSHVFLCIGLDIQLEEMSKREIAMKQYSEFAKEHDKTLLVVTTNMRHVFPNGNRSIQHAALFSAMVLAYGLKTLYIPASHNIDELFPWGSHLLTDPLLSNGITDVIHHGAVSRTEKTAMIAANQQALDSIRICNSSEEFNCGECEKCIRTMFALAVLNKQTKSLPALSDKMALLKKVKIFRGSQVSFWQDNYSFAMAHKRTDLAKYASNIVRSYQWRQWLKQGFKLLGHKSN